MKLLNVLRNKPICNDFHFILFGLVIFIISVRYYIIFIFFITYLIFIYKRIKYITIPLCVICFIFLGSYLFNNKDCPNLNTIEGKYTINDIDDKYLYLKGEYNIICYKNNELLDIGDKIDCRIKIYHWDDKSYDNEFDYKEYYKAKGIDYRGYIIDYDIIGYEFVISSIKAKLLEFYDYYLKDKSFTYFKALVFGINDFDDDIKDAYQAIYISHILAISGMHLVFIYNLLVKIFRYLFRIEGSLLAIIIISLYLFIINFPVAGLRAYLFLLLGYLNNIGKIKYTKLDIYSISFIIMSFINPLMCYQNSFILSYLVSFLLIFINDLVNFKSKLLNNIIISLLSILITFPFIINMSNEINIINIGLSVFINIIVTMFLLPLTFSLIIIPIMPVEFIFNFLDIYLLNIANIFKPINISSFNLVTIIIYYVIFGLIIFKRKYYSILVLFLLLILNINNLSPYYKVTYIDVGQGDSILIEYPYRKKVILIDSFNNVKYLKSIGINKIDVVFLSHNDIDHMGSINDIILEFNIEKIYRSCYEEELDFKTIPLSYNSIINIDNISFKVLGPIRKYLDSNSNSLVIQCVIEGYTFLFTGDASIDSEYDLINRYGNSLSSYFLKVGHHGSITSSSTLFLSYVKPKISIVSVGKNNKYNLPDLEVINRLKYYGIIYNTSHNGNIYVYLKDGKYKIDCYRN